MGQSTVIAMAFTAIMFVAGVSLLLMTCVSSFDTLSGVITDQSQQNEVFLHERVEFGSWTLDDSNILRVNITNTGDTTMMLNDIKNADLLVSLNNGSETTRWVGFDQAQKGWLAGWGQRVKMTIDSNDVDSVLSEFPVLIYLSTSSGRNSDDVSFVFDELQNDANRRKIAVTTSDGVSQCYVEVEEWDDANEEAWLWVNVPSVNSTIDTTLYLYYDADHADNTVYVGDPDSSPAETVWDDDFRLVTHMRDDPDTSHIRDSTGFDNDGTKVAAGEPAVTTSGNVSDAQDFDGGNDLVNLGSDASLDLRSSNFTVEAWIYPTTQTTRWPTIYVVGNWELSFGIGQDTSTDKLEVWVNDRDIYASDSDVTYNAWNYVVLSWDGSNYNFFIDGEADGSPSGSAYPDTGTTYIGGITGQGDSYFAGIIDEVRTSNTSRTSSWIKASFESGKDDLIDFGSEEPTQGGWLTGWDQRVNMMIDSNDVGSVLSDFPVLIHLSTSSGRNSDDVSFIFDELQNDANRLKIAVTTSDGVSQCYVEVEEWDDANEEAYLWVNVPSVNSTIDTELYLYYDADHADNTAYVGDPNSSPAEAVWANDFRFVTHMKDDPDTSHIRDSTGYDNDGTKVAAGEPAVTTSGNVSDAQSFDGGNDYLNITPCPDSLKLLTTDFTIEAWAYPHNVAEENVYIANDWHTVSGGWGLGVWSDASIEVFIGNEKNTTAAGVVTQDQWNYITVAFDDSSQDVLFYKDGAWLNTESAPDEVGYTTGRPFTIGVDPRDLSGYEFDGILDEIRVSTTLRSADWIKASFESGRDDLVDFGSEELTSDHDGSSTDYWLINRVFFRDSEGDLMNPMELSDPVHGGWDPWETIEIFVNLVEVDPTFRYLTFITPNGVQAHSSLSVDLDYGRATITAGESTVTVNHDLGRIPVNIQLTAGGAINQEFWARDWTDTTFVIEVENNQPDDIVFFWQVR